jgi:hypothetical protein
MTTLFDVLSPLAVTDLANGSRMDAESLGDGLVWFRAGANLPYSVVGEFELRDLSSAGSSAVPLTVSSVLFPGSCDDVRRVDTSVIPTEVPGVATASSGGASSNDQSSTVHAHLPAVQYDVSVMTCLGASAFLERMRDALIRWVRNKISDGRPKPRKFRSAHHPAALRVAVLPIPVVVGSAESEGVMRSDAAVKFTKSFDHKRIMPCGRPCCHLAANIVLGVPTS